MAMVPSIICSSPESLVVGERGYWTEAAMRPVLLLFAWMKAMPSSSMGLALPISIGVISNSAAFLFENIQLAMH